MVLRAFAESGLSRAAFAAQHGIHEQRLYQWQRKLASASPVDAQPVAFRELEKAALTDVQRPFELVLRSGMILRIPATFEPAGLGHLLQVLCRFD
jgi:transposase-like protein